MMAANCRPANRMGRSYWFECAKCGYRATVSGRTDRGVHFFVQTILCRDCKALYDAVTKLKFPDEGRLGLLKPLGLRQPKKPNVSRPPSTPPSFQAALNRLPYTGVKRFRWVHFQLQCPVSKIHRVQTWNEPDRCPRCGLYLEKNALPYRIWD
jgi:hypothetical protein